MPKNTNESIINCIHGEMNLQYIIKNSKNVSYITELFTRIQRNLEDTHDSGNPFHISRNYLEKEQLSPPPSEKHKLQDKRKQF